MATYQAARAATRDCGNIRAGRFAVDFGAGQGASGPSPTGIADIRSDLGPASNPERFRGQKRRNPSGAKQTSRGRRRSLVKARCGDEPRSLLALRPSASTRGPLQDFNSLQGNGRNTGEGAAGLSKSSAKKVPRKSVVKKAQPKKRLGPPPPKMKPARQKPNSLNGRHIAVDRLKRSRESLL